MSLFASDTGNNFEPTPMGMQQAVCCFVNDIGLQKSDFDGKEIIKHQVIISWELLEKMSDNRPFMVSKWYTLSLHKKAALRHDLENWRGKAFTDEELKGFDLEKLIGVNCLLNLIENQNGKAKVASVNPLPKGLVAIKRINEEMSDKFKEFINNMRAKQVTQVLDDSPNQDREEQKDISDLPF